MSAPAAARLGGGVTGGEHGDAHVLAGARRQRDRAAHHLVGLAGIDAEPHRQLDGLVELGRARLFDEVERLGRRVQLLAVEPLGRVVVLLAVAVVAIRAPSW